MSIKSGTGVIVGRFQVFELNEVHKRLIGTVIDKHQQTIVFLGTNPAPSDQNPLDWHLRWQMFQQEYGDNIRVEEIEDHPDDRVWSQELDRRILEMRPEGKVVLYGSRIEFTERYNGRYESEALEASPDDFEDELGTEGIRYPRDFRAGMIYATMRRFPTVYPTVDIALFRNEYHDILLARKSNETKFRFPGGFTDPSDDSFEMAAVRELMEECGELDIDELTYLGSSLIDDWRYRGSMDSVMTHLYACLLVSGEPEANDDIAEVRWFEVGKVQQDILVPEHRVLLGFVQEYLIERGDLS